MCGYTVDLILALKLWTIDLCPTSVVRPSVLAPLQLLMLLLKSVSTVLVLPSESAPVQTPSEVAWNHRFRWILTPETWTPQVKKNENEENIKTRQRLIHHVKNKRAMSNQWKTSSWLQHVLTPILPNSLLAQTTDQLGMKWYTSQLKLYPCYIPIGWFVPISEVLECASQVLSKLVTPVVDKSWWSQ